MIIDARKSVHASLEKAYPHEDQLLACEGNNDVHGDRFCMKQ
jgi:hypothetical protein